MTKCTRRRTFPLLAFVATVSTVLASCSSTPKRQAASSSAAASVSTLSDSLELSSEAPTITGVASESDSEKVAAILRQLGTPNRSGWTEVAGTGPCPLFATPGEWAFEFDPPAVFCKLSEDASVAIVPDDAFAVVSQEFASGARSFPAVPFDEGTIDSACDDEACIVVWNDGVTGVARLTADREEGVAWLKEHLRMVLQSGAAIDLSQYKFPDNGTTAESAETEVLDTAA